MQRSATPLTCERRLLPTCRLARVESCLSIEGRRTVGGAVNSVELSALANETPSAEGVALSTMLSWCERAAAGGGRRRAAAALEETLRESKHRRSDHMLAMLQVCMRIVLPRTGEGDKAGLACCTP